MRAAHPNDPRGSRPRQNGLTSRCSARGFRRGRPPRGEGRASSDSGFAPSLFRAAPQDGAVLTGARSPSPGSLAPPSGKRSAKNASSVLRHARSAASGAPVPAPCGRQRPAIRRSPLTGDPRYSGHSLIRAFLEAAGKNGPLQLRCARQKPPRSAPLRKKPNAVAVNPFPFAPQGCRSA